MELSFLERPHQEDLHNGDHPSVFFQHKNYKLLIYRLFTKNMGTLNVESHCYIIDNDNNIFNYNRYENKFIKIDDYKSFYHILDTLVDKTMEEAENHVELIEDLEESIYESRNSIQEWFTLKKEMVRIERLLSQAAKIHMEFIKSSEAIKSDTELLTEFEDIEEHLNRVFRFCVMNIDKLDNIYSLYTIIANENMRKTMLFLTVISAIFLPINIVVGFFGINTQGLYFSGNPHATDYVALIIVSILTALGVFLFIKRKSFY